MRISVFGLGYVGCVSSACFSDTGHEVIGVDTNPLKVEIINDGRSPVVEPGVEDLIGRAVKDRRVRATTDATEPIVTRVSLVGRPRFPVTAPLAAAAPVGDPFITPERPPGRGREE